MIGLVLQRGVDVQDTPGVCSVKLSNFERLAARCQPHAQDYLNSTLSFSTSVQTSPFFLDPGTMTASDLG
jgi:hypothetical protein